VAGGARSAQTLERVRAAGADALEVDVTDQASPRPSSRAWAAATSRIATKRTRWKPGQEQGAQAGVAAYALDHDNADRLWELSLELIGGRGGG